MKLLVLSDLHLEFSGFTPPKVESDVIVLAGDIWIGSKGIGWARESFPEKEIIYVAGNHEFYGSQRLNTLAELSIVANDCGVRFLDNQETEINGVRFLGSTLWSDFMLFGKKEQQRAMAEAQRCISDFRVIHEGGRGHFSPSHCIELFEKSRTWLETKLSEKFDGKTVVVTHHLPSARSVADRFSSDILSASFASNLDHLFGKADLWIHGHTHDNFDYKASGTRILCNPRGYVSWNRGVENPSFNQGLVIEI